MVNFKVNGTDRSFDGDPDMPLLWYLRDDLRLTGTRFGCGAGLWRLHRARGRTGRQIVSDARADAGE